MRGKLVGVLIGAAAALTFGVVTFSNAQALDSTRDCDQFAVIRCGAMSAGELRAEYDTQNGSSSNGTTTRQNDIQRIFSSFNISRADLNGSFADGVVHRDGRVTVNGRTVATGATTAGRNMGGTPISGTSAAKIPTSRMADDQTALVKLDQNGRFLFAVIKPCGNPVTATPPPKPPEPPKPKPAAECETLTATPLSRTQFRLNATASVENGATISGYTFVVTSESGQQVARETVRTTARTAAFNTPDLPVGTHSASVTVATSVGNKNGEACKVKLPVKPEPPVPPQPPVVPPKEESPCPVPGKEHLPADSPDCVETPPKLPETGALSLLSNLFGLAAIGGASGYYLTSRR